MDAVLPALTQFVSGLFGSYLGSGSCRCEVVFSGPTPGNEVLELLGKQLERCGPAQLGAQPLKCPDCPPPAVVLQLIISVFLVAVGFLAGFAWGRTNCAVGTPVPGTASSATGGTKAAEAPREDTPRPVITPRSKRLGASHLLRLEE